VDLHPIDDLPFHQAPTPFNVVGTSDVHFNDGYWFATYTDDLYLAVGLRVHPNMNVFDGFVGVSTHGRQRTARFSRPLRPAYDSLELGPLRLEIREPMRRLGLTLTESPADIAFDLEFDAVSPPFLETPSRHYKFGHLINDLVRYIQVGRTSGSVTTPAGTRTVETWHAIRDHSWGVRASMGPRTWHGGIAGPDEERDPRRFRLWVPFEVEDHAGFFHLHEDGDGNPLDTEGRLWFPDGSSVEVVACRHELRYHEGTHNPSGGTFVLTDDRGHERRYELGGSSTPADVQGFGYYAGWHDRENPGTYRGDDLVAEHDDYEADPTRPDGGPPRIPAAKRVGPTEFPSPLTGPGGATGMAHFEHYVLGPYRRYGFHQ
jgi:hypothetical protein